MPMSSSETTELFPPTAVGHGLSLWVDSPEFLPLSESLPRPHFLSPFNTAAHSEELSASVVGFPNNCYRCCESIEEGRQALDAFLARQAAAAPAPRPTPLERWNRGPIMPIEDSWWCCFAGAEPGVYHRL